MFVELEGNWHKTYSDLNNAGRKFGIFVAHEYGMTGLQYALAYIRNKVDIKDADNIQLLTDIIDKLDEFAAQARSVE